MKCIYTTNETIRRIKDLQNGKKISAYYIPDRELIFIIHKELKKLNVYDNLINKWANGMIRHFSEDEEQVVNKYMEKCSSLATRVM